jgi:hypothetical protein
MTMGTKENLTPHKGGFRVPHKPPNFRRSDLQRAIRGALEEGLDIGRVEVGKDGGFKLVITDQESAAKQQWRREDTEVEDWITKQKSKTGVTNQKHHANKR